MSGPYFESGYININYFEGDGVTQSADATLTSAVSVTVSGSITRAGDSTLTVNTTHSTEIQRNRFAEVSITDAFNVTFTVNASKNMLSDIISQFNTSITASKIAANQSTLNNIVTLSLQGDRSRALAATTLSSEFTQSTQIQRILTAQSTHNAEFAISISANKILLGTSTLNTEFAQTVAIIRTRNISHTFNFDTNISTTVGKLQNATCDFGALFSPTLTCVALKNHTAVLNAVSSFNCVITKTTAFTVTLNTEFGFNVNISTLKTVSATVNSVSALSVGAVKTVHSVITFNSTFSITNKNPAVSPNFFVGTLETAQSSISSQFGLTITFITFVSKWFNHPYRPLNLLEPAGAPGRRIFSTSIKKFGSHALGGDNSKIRLNAGQGNDIDGNFTANDLPDLFGINDDIYKDLWMRVDGGENFTRRIWDFGFGPAVGIYNRKLYVTNSFFINNNWTQPTYGSSTEPGDIMTTQLSTGVFHHVAYIYTASQKRHSLYVNGTRVITALPGFSGNAPNWYDTSQIDTLSPVYFDSGATFNQYYDDMKWFRNYTFGYTANDTTIAVPSTEYTPLDNVYTNLGALYRFDDNYLDSLAILVSAQANISATVTATITAGKSVSASATVNTQFAVSVIIGEIEPAVISMNTESSLSTVATRIKSFTVSMNAEATQSVAVVKTTNTTITLNSAVSISCTVTRIFVLQSNFAAIASQLGVVARVGAGLILAETFVTQSTTAVKITNITLTLVSQTNSTITVDRIRPGTATLNTDIQCTINTFNSRIRGHNSAISAQCGVQAQADRFRLVTSGLNTAITLSCESEQIVQGVGAGTSNFGISIVVIRNRFVAINLQTAHTLTAAGIKAVEAELVIAVVSQITTTVNRFRPFAAVFNTLASKLSVVAKTGQGLVTIVTQSTQLTVAHKTTDITALLPAVSTHTVSVNRTRPSTAVLVTQFVAVINGTTSTDTTLNVLSSVSTQVTAQKIVRGLAVLASVNAFQMTAVAIKNLEIVLSTQFTQVTVAKRFRGITFNISTTSTLGILAGRLASANSVQNVTLAQTVTAGVLRLQDIIYYVPTETRTFNINNEQRTYALRQENRLYTIEE